MKRLTLFAVVVLIVLFVVDISMANWANRRIIARDADFAENYNPEALDWDTPGRQLCKFKYELWIYAYQTCFRVEWVSENLEDRHFTYSYRSPRRRSAIFSKHTPEAYYFQEIGGTASWKSINFGGTIRYNIGSKQQLQLKADIIGE